MFRRFGSLLLMVGVVVGFYLVSRQWPAAAQTGDNNAPLDLTSGSPEPLSLRVGEKTLVALSHSGGTGFFWRASSENSDVATANYLTSRSEKKRPEMVGAVENDIFQVQAFKPGSAQIRFELGRAGTKPISQQTVLVQVTPNT